MENNLYQCTRNSMNTVYMCKLMMQLFRIMKLGETSDYIRMYNFIKVEVISNMFLFLSKCFCIQGFVFWAQFSVTIVHGKLEFWFIVGFSIDTWARFIITLSYKINYNFWGHKKKISKTGQFSILHQIGYISSINKFD